jgi:hypothetical protein
MNKDRIFIHIPRTGGKSLFGLLNFKLTLRMHFKTLKKEDILPCNGKILKTLHFPDTYKDFNKNNIKSTPIFTIIRNPKDRYISEWKRYFSCVKKYDKFPIEYIDFFKNNSINDFKAYSNCKFTHNTQTKLLLGYILYEKEDVSIDDANHILKEIENDNILPITFDIMCEIFSDIHRAPSSKEPIIDEEIDKNLDISHCNLIDEYLYNNIIQNFSHKLILAKSYILNNMLKPNDRVNYIDDDDKLS